MGKAALPQEAPDNRLPGTLCGVMEILHFPSEIPEQEKEKQEEKKILRGSQLPALKHTNSVGFATYLVLTNQHHVTYKTWPCPNHSLFRTDQSQQIKSEK